MTSIAPKDKSPYVNLLQAVKGSDHPTAWVTLGPCAGDDNERGDSAAPEIGTLRQPLGPCVGDEGPCDRRLKKDVRPVAMLPTGLQLYSFKYWNDDQTFVCVMAQDLLGDDRFNHAVSQSEGGYFKVDFAALGLEIAGSKERFRHAGRRALREALPATS